MEVEFVLLTNKL